MSISFFCQYYKITAYNNMAAHFADFFHKPLKMRIHFGRSACDIYRLDFLFPADPQTSLHHITLHDFLTVWACFHMAMLA